MTPIEHTQCSYCFGRHDGCTKLEPLCTASRAARAAFGKLDRHAEHSYARAAFGLPPRWLIHHSQVYFSIVDVESPDGDEWTATRNTKNSGIDWHQTGLSPMPRPTQEPPIPAAVKAHVEHLLDTVAGLPFEDRRAFCALHTDDFVVTQ